MHIPDHKELTMDKPIKALPGDKIHIYPIKQHIGAPLNIKVSEGDEVLAGQVLADSSAFVAAPVHSSVSGKVIKIKPHIHPSGETVMSVFVENDFKYKKAEKICTKKPENMTREELLAVIRKSGIVGMGGAGFPTHVKLSPPAEKKIDYLIVNGAECEPYITADHRRMLEMPDEIIGGVKTAMKILGVDRAYIGIETNKKDAIGVMTKKAAEAGNIKVCPLKTKYPQGAEKQLIYAISKRRVPSGALPADVGAVVINADTAAQIYRAVTFGEPLTKRIVTVSGDCIANPGNFEVYTGVSFDYLIQAAGGFCKEAKKIIMGGPMMGIAQYSTEAPVIKTTSSILALSEEESRRESETACIRCARCTDHCPMQLMPLYLNKFAKDSDFESAQKYNILDCIECGMCSYICPARQGLLENIRTAKQHILQSRKKQAAAD